MSNSKSRYKSYKMFFDGLALLHTIANHQTMFFAYLLSYMDDDNVVILNAGKKREIMKEIRYVGKDPLRAADQHLYKLKKVGLVTSMGGGNWMVNPKLAGNFGDYKFLVDKKVDLFLKITGKSNGTVIGTMGIK